MVRKKIINPHRIRSIKGGFAFIPHRFVTEGFLGSLSAPELLLYLFLVAVSDRHGLSFYGSGSICSLLHMTSENYRKARQNLIEKDLIDFDGAIFQVLELPSSPGGQASSDPGIRELCKNLFAEV
ncbi:hypothetical protein ACFLZM_07505 [Thermodesulfobacteriota bacterium]